MLRKHCLYCDTTLVRYRHWGICPRCPTGRAFLDSITPPSLATQMQDRVGGLLLDVGRPTTNGVRR